MELKSADPVRRPATFCNPVNINYQYQPGYRGRESADPAVVLYKDKYFLFASHGTGYWISDDLAEWEFIRVDTAKYPDFTLFAPATLVIGERMYITHCQGGNILYSDDPFDPDSWVNIGKAYDWNDPAFLYDDDGYVYLYEGLDRVRPLHAAKLDPADNMRLVEGPAAIFSSDHDNRGYERHGNNNEDGVTLPCLEGAWVNKLNGRYYLTYAVPGTEVSTYCDGVAVSDSPMGPFINCDNSPAAFKNTGFMRGAGHGCLFEDKHGNLWKMDTVSISVNHMFERRLCLFPAKLASDGRLYVNTLRGDYPMFLPHDTGEPFSHADAGLSLLSYGRAAVASSSLDGAHAASCAFDENMKTWWSACSGADGEWLKADLGREYEVFSVQINFADQDIVPCGGRDNGFAYKYTLEGSRDGEAWEMLVDRTDGRDDLSHEYFELPSGTRLRYIRFTNRGIFPAGGKAAISGLRVFGPPQGAAPEQAPEFRAERGVDERDMTVTWTPVRGAEGYIVRFGVDPAELHTQYQIIGEERAEIRSLIRGVKYYVTVDSYGPGGIAKGTELQYV
ncbi:MAG: family 43 glycosylhydrolase [Clostridia bacterium]|nr:family 43 glycosylhydrolase [Clostridia bacterium]